MLEIHSVMQASLLHLATWCLVAPLGCSSLGIMHCRPVTQQKKFSSSCSHIYQQPGGCSSQDWRNLKICCRGLTGRCRSQRAGEGGGSFKTASTRQERSLTWGCCSRQAMLRSPAQRPSHARRSGRRPHAAWFPYTPSTRASAPLACAQVIHPGVQILLHVMQASCMHLHHAQYSVPGLLILAAISTSLQPQAPMLDGQHDPDAKPWREAPCSC